jgi:hypothetical protein
MIRSRFHASSVVKLHVRACHCGWLATIALAVAIAGACTAEHARGEVIFDNLPAVLPTNIPSLGYQANHVAAFGDKITFAGTDRNVTDIRVIMTNGALHVDWPGVGDASGYDHSLTFSVYNPGPGNAVGSLIGSLTQTVHVPWHTVNGFSATAFYADFDFGGVVMPDTIIFGLAFNTQSWGASPIGVAGPYNSLNYGVVTAPPSIGTDPYPDNVYLSANGSAFIEDTGWTPYAPAIQVTAVPEPTSLSLLGILSLGWLARNRRRG